MCMYNVHAYMLYGYQKQSLIGHFITEQDVEIQPCSPVFKPAGGRRGREGSLLHHSRRQDLQREGQFEKLYRPL